MGTACRALATRRATHSRRATGAPRSQRRPRRPPRLHDRRQHLCVAGGSSRRPGTSSREQGHGRELLTLCALAPGCSLPTVRPERPSVPPIAGIGGRWSSSDPRGRVKSRDGSTSSRDSIATRTRLRTRRRMSAAHRHCNPDVLHWRWGACWWRSMREACLRGPPCVLQEEGSVSYPFGLATSTSLSLTASNIALRDVTAEEAG